ncbi:MAG TPA: MazG nucleotide pyrophosphohydrolase domain-containing protein [Candidatus Bathyarchaeia archaeon]|nr:MazG nucleotide pyrophosphohydrolase domain-containing protein [Candidatus Bathyarchaeia archaeon]
MPSKTITDYQKELSQIDKGLKKPHDYTSMLILAIVEEVGEMARAYLAKKGHKPINKRAQKDESYKQELGDIILAIIKLASIKHIDLEKQIRYSLQKIKKRRQLFG